MALGYAGVSFMEQQLQSQEAQESLAYVLGGLVSDGCFNPNKYGVSFIVKDKDFVDHFYECFNSVFNVKHYNNRVNEGVSIHSDGRWAYKVNQKEINDFLKQFLENYNSTNWSVPDFIKNSTPSVKCSFLSALFDGEGTVNNTVKQITIFFYSSNFNAIQETKRLLSDVGISSSISRLNRQGKGYISKGKQYIYKSDIFALRFSGYENISLFSRFIGFKIKRKQERVDYYLKTFSYSVNFWSKEQDDYLRENFKVVNDSEIAKFLGPPLTKIAVAMRRRKLGLSRKGLPRKSIFNKEDLKYIQENYQIKGDKEISEMIHKNWSSIRGARQKMDLFKEHHGFEKR